MQKTYPIVLNADENYIKYASVLITSVINSTKVMGRGHNKPYNFQILVILSQMLHKKNFKNFKIGYLKLSFRNKNSSLQQYRIYSLKHINGNHLAYCRLLLTRFITDKKHYI